MADGRHVGKYSKWHNSPTNGPTGTQLGWSNPIMCPTCPLWCGCHGDGRCLATAHWTFCSYGRLGAERVNQFWWNSVHSSTLEPQWQSRDQILKFKGRTATMLENIGNTITRLAMDLLWRNLAGRIPSCSRHVRPKWGCRGNSRCLATGLATALWTFISYGRLEAESVNQIWWNLVCNSKLGPQWQSWDQILKFLKFKMADGRCWKVFEMP